MLNLDHDLQIIFFSFVLSFCLSLAMVGVFRFLRLNDPSLKEKRSVHFSPTPRLGGLLALVAIFSAFFLTGISFDHELIIILFPIVILGILEDLGIPTSSKLRLAGGCISAVIFIYLKNTWIREANVIGFDFLLNYKIFAYLFTIFCLVALLNSFNLIDGMHGLATGKIILASGAILVLTGTYHEPSIQVLSLAILSATVGLFVLNYPVGRIFLGDTGAYSFGIMIGMSLVTLKFKYPDISGWAIFLILFWPVTETSHSMIRRRFAKKATDKPDMMHMHHLIMRSLETISDRKLPRRVSNPLSTGIILPLASIPVILALLYPEEDFFLFCSTIIFLILFSTFYFILARKRKIKVVSLCFSVFTLLKKFLFRRLDTDS